MARLWYVATARLRMPFVLTKVAFSSSCTNLAHVFRSAVSRPTSIRADIWAILRQRSLDLCSSMLSGSSALRPPRS